MAKPDKICMELMFTQNITHSQRGKVKEFWKFIDTTCQLKPYKVSSDSRTDKELSRDKDDDSTLELSRRKWYNQLKVFHKHGLDKTAVAAAEKPCNPCDTKKYYECTEFADTVKEPYEELLDDMKAFDEKLNNET